MTKKIRYLTKEDKIAEKEMMEIWNVIYDQPNVLKHLLEGGLISGEDTEKEITFILTTVKNDRRK